jgi:queuine tRNA-ribosyltransferase
VLKVTEDGVLFRSYRDGKKVLLTPESSIDAQKDLGADIIIPFDELPPYHIGRDALIESLERTHRWEKRSLERHLMNPQGQAMYAVIHGGVDPELRQKSCDYLGALPFDGFAIGGSVGKTKDEMYEMLATMVPRLPVDRPNHLLGIGDLPSIEACIPLGIDTFDSSYPTKAARHGVAFRQGGPLYLTKGENASKFEPIERKCSCYTCQHFTVGYLNHLFKAREITALTLTTIHNLHYMVQLMERYRIAIAEDLI